MAALSSLILPLIFGFFDLHVNWASPNRVSLNIQANHQDAKINQCLENGLEVRYRFKVRLCRRRALWIDDCSDERVDTHKVQSDPISQKYDVILDTHHDTENPKTIFVDSAQAALALGSALRAVQISSLPGGPKGAFDRRRYYVGVRVVSECRGDSGSFLAQIPLILSFGLINSAVNDTGWVGFDLNSGQVVQP